ncbi:MAG: prepilin-type N-terminal cleavage/methylation domain-containing protein [bacterium]
MKTYIKPCQSAFTLVEVVIAMALVSLVSAAMLMALTRGSALCYSTTHHYAGYSLCRETIEQMRGANYGMVIEDNFPPTNMLLTHLGGTARIPLMCTRYITNDIVELSNPTRKQVTVAVSWDYQGKPQLEIMTGFIYYK